MMTRRGRGGFISIDSFLEHKDRKAATEDRLRLASSQIREAAKIGMQSLYADPDEVLNKYKDFDIIKAMQDRRDAKLLWVRARAIDADVVNANGDYFSEKELLSEVEDQQGNKMPAYKTFEGVPIYTNHKNDDITEAKGMVVYAEWDDTEKCVWCTFVLDEEAYPDIARGIRVGYMHDVSMGCQVESGTCSECGNVATTEKEYCDCLKKYKGKLHPRTGKKVYEKNHGLKFIELSVVGDGAFDSCAIQEIYDVEEILAKALCLDKKAGAIHDSIVVASAMLPHDIEERRAYEQALRIAYDTTKQTIRLAQTAGTLVGGQLLAGEGAGNNTTVGNILKFLGIDPQSGLNILDMLNLALNFLEVAVMNLFARKDNVDLSHVGKITKSMADLQATMQDMIDDGVETGGNAQQPMNQQQLQGGNAAPQGPNAPQEDYSPAGNVGRAIGPQPGQPAQPEQPAQPAAPQTQNQAFPGIGMGFGGGIFASRKLPKLVWASGEEVEGKSVRVASRKTGDSRGESAVLRLSQSLTALADTLGLQLDETSTPKAAVNTQPLKNNTTKASTQKPPTTGGTKDMDFFKQFEAARAKKEAAVVEQEFKVADKLGHRLVLSSNGSVRAYYQDQEIDFEPEITEEYRQAISHDQGHKVAAAMLEDFRKFVRTAEWKPNHDTETVMQEQLEAKRTGEEQDIKERMLDNKADRYNRTHEEQDIKEREHAKKGLLEKDEQDIKERMLEDKAGLYSRLHADIDVRENLIADARRGHPETIIEEQLRQVRENYGPGDSGLVMTAATEALANAVIAARVTPEEVVEAAKKLAAREDLADLIQLAHLGSSVRKAAAQRRAFHNIEDVEVASENAVIEALGNIVSKDITAADLSEAICVASSEVTRTVKAATKLAKEKMGENSTLEPSTIRKTVSRADRMKAALAAIAEKEVQQPVKDHLKAALFAFASAVDEIGAHPHEIVASLSDKDDDTLLQDVEVARSAASTENRLTSRARRSFWGVKVASKENVYDNVVGWLADYAEASSFPSSVVVTAAKRLLEQPTVAENLITRIVAAQKKTAAINVTDERTNTKRIECTVADLGGLTPKDDGFEQAFRDKAIQLFAENNYQVDPATFTFTDLNINGESIVASVTSTVRKTFTAESATPDAMGTPSVEVVPTEEPNVIMSQSAKELRQAQRKEILARYAQAMPGAPAPAAPTPDMGTAADGLGMSALTVPTADENPMEEEADVDNMPEPGSKKPWGTVCPQCSSTDLDVANGAGKCNSCGANIEFEFLARVKPSEGDAKDDEAPAADAGAEPALGGDMGLGAATAPQPTPPAPAAPGTAPTGMMMAASYETDARVFVRTAQLGDKLDREGEKVLPVGFICPKCANRHAKKVRNSTYCYDCGTVSKSEVKEAEGKPGRVVCSIKWFID